MSKINDLTPQQEKDCEAYYQEVVKIGRSIEPINHEKAEACITTLYTRLGKPKPTFLYFKSIHDIIVQYPEVQINQYFGGQQWIYWKAFYIFGERIGVQYDAEDSKILHEGFALDKELHWWFPFENAVLISERPIRLSINAAGLLHDESEKAYEYADGYGFCYLNGVKVPEYLVKTAAEDLDIKDYLKETNADVKVEWVRKYGVERMLEFGKKVDGFEKYPKKENPFWHESQYELWDMAKLFPGLDFQPYLKMLNQTVGIWHMEACSPSCRTLKDALKERFGGREMKIRAIA